MADPATLDPANAAHADLVATLAAAAPPVLPEEFVTPDFSDASAEDISAIDAAAEAAEAYMMEVQSAVAAVEAATAAITAKVTVLTAAQKAMARQDEWIDV